MGKSFLVASLLLLFLAGCATTQTPSPVDPNMSNDQLWTMLTNGNGRYAGNSLTFGHLINLRAATAPPNDQNPPVTILSCADSRVPAELVFHQSVGQLFVTREAGNVADQFTLASIEFAIVKKYTRMIVVLGHEACGAVVSAMTDSGGTPALDALVARIRTSFPDDICTDPIDPVCVRGAVVLNTKASARYLITASPTIRGAVCTRPPAERVSMRAAYYNLASGRVEPIDLSPDELCRP
jgi:carbonic anhydrase